METNVKSYIDSEIIKRVESLSTFKGWKKGKYDIWIRSNEDAFDKFDDKVYNFEVKEEGKEPIFVAVHSGTTNPGSQGLKNFEKYGNKRCAVLVADYMVYNSHEYRKHKGEYYAYCQCKAWPYNWDDNHNEISGDGIKVVNDQIIGANDHAAGENSSLVGGWSIACLVRNVKTQFNDFMNWMNKDKYVTVVILKEW